ncbi:hypothetical protein Q9233_004967 [Columba guinea]|nr:hypothetical protein Q9233_004967 [Columba guinea]
MGIVTNTLYNGVCDSHELSNEDVLEIKVSHQGYADPNNLRFTQIKILGLSSTVRRVMVSQDGQEIPSPHVVSYNSEKQKDIDFVELAVELEHRIDFELKEGLMESRYWSAVTSHTAYWSSMDITLVLLTFV